jgi:hypothetical protein
LVGIGDYIIRVRVGVRDGECLAGLANQFFVQSIELERSFLFHVRVRARFYY